ncbi:MAG: hypothetical protein JNG89_18720, partial [Planctomycetaceae bacterium]|nr:hypothetical protein [Planctomycetaceae bacterium]
RQPAVTPPAQVEMLNDADFLPVESAAGVWRQGKLLVVRKGAALPPRCIKSNQPAEVTLKRTLYWHHPAIYLVILVNLLVYAVVAISVRKKAVLDVRLSQAWASRRRWGIATGWLISLGGVALFFVAAALDENIMPFVIIAGIICMLIIGPIYGVLRSQLISPKKITDEYAWIKGAHPDYLAELREFPGEAGWQ